MKTNIIPIKSKAVRIITHCTQGSSADAYATKTHTAMLSLGNKVQYQSPLTKLEANTVREFPETLRYYGASSLDHPQILRLLETNNACAYQLLISFYNNTRIGARLEPLLLNSGEHIYYLLSSLVKNRIKPRHPEQFYWQALRMDSFWGYKYALDSKRQDLILDLANYAKSTATTHASSAYMHLMLDPDASAAPFVDILRKSPFYSLLASRFLFSRGVKIDPREVADITPRWAYYFLLHGVPDHEQRDWLILELAKCPRWLVEYIVDKPLIGDPPLVSRLFTLCTDDKTGQCKDSDDPRPTLIYDWILRYKKTLKVA
jgi:hypothetical protein